MRNLEDCATADLSWPVELPNPFQLPLVKEAVCDCSRVKERFVFLSADKIRCEKPDFSLNEKPEIPDNNLNRS